MPEKRGRGSKEEGKKEKTPLLRDTTLSLLPRLTSLLRVVGLLLAVARGGRIASRDAIGAGRRRRAVARAAARGAGIAHGGSGRRWEMIGVGRGRRGVAGGAGRRASARETAAHARAAAWVAAGAAPPSFACARRMSAMRGARAPQSAQRPRRTPSARPCRAARCALTCGPRVSRWRRCRHVGRGGSGGGGAMWRRVVVAALCVGRGPACRPRSS